MSHLSSSLICLMLFFGLTGLAGAAAQLQSGTEFSPLILDDQHGQSLRTTTDTRLVLFTGDMEGGKIVRKLLDERADAAEILKNAGASYVSDVSAMPAMIRRMMALPAMRKRPYPIMLDSEGKKTSSLPRRPGAVTLLRLEHSMITTVDFLSEPAQLAKILGIEDSPNRD